MPLRIKQKDNFDLYSFRNNDKYKNNVSHHSGYIAMLIAKSTPFSVQCSLLMDSFKKDAVVLLPTVVNLYWKVLKIMWECLTEDTPKVWICLLGPMGRFPSEASADAECDKCGWLWTHFDMPM